MTEPKKAAKQPSMSDILFDMEQRVRRNQAMVASDVQFLRENLRSAADRFTDLAIMVEVGQKIDAEFLRTSAERFRRAAGV